MTQQNCNHCHYCGTRLTTTPNGEEYCPFCCTNRRYRSHGWPPFLTTDTERYCPDSPILFYTPEEETDDPPPA